MIPRLLLLTLLLGTSSAPAQDTVAPEPKPEKQAQEEEQKPKKGPLGRVKDKVKDQLSDGCVSSVLNTCWGNKPGKDQTSTPPTVPGSPRADQRNAPPRSDDGPYSSSKSPDAGLDEPDVDTSGTTEMHAYDPHQAEKDIEVGDFYRKRKNYKAAISRYREALEWKPNDPAATIRLAMVSEQAGELADAHRYYVLYLAISPEGANAPTAKQALARIEPRLQMDANAVRALTALELGEYHLEQKNFPAAVTRLKEAEQLTPDAARVVFRLAQALEATGEFSAAHARYQRYLEMQPDGSFARAAQRGLKRLQANAEQQRKAATAPSAETPR